MADGWPAAAEGGSTEDGIVDGPAGLAPLAASRLPWE